MKVLPAEFNHIHEIYMNCTDMDKDTFCREYRNRSGNMAIIDALNDTATRNAERVRKLIAEKDAMIVFLVEQAEKWGAPDLRQKAIDMMGLKEYLAYKIRKGYNLWQMDRDAITEILETE